MIDTSKLLGTSKLSVQRSKQTTVPTFNSCTKCVGSPGRIHDRTPDCPQMFLGMDVFMTSQLL